MNHKRLTQHDTRQTVHTSSDQTLGSYRHAEQCPLHADKADCC